MRICKCGCGQEIIKKPHHKWFGIPKFIHGHNINGKNNPMYGVRLTGKNNSNWKGGKIKQEGYIYILKPEHPFCNSQGYVFEHRLVVEKQIGRHLLPQEEIHHINGIKTDNRFKNLRHFSSKSEHTKFHNAKRILSKKTKEKISNSLKTHYQNLKITKKGGK